MKLLLIEDDEKISGFIARGLEQAGYLVDVVGDGAEGLVLAQEVEYQLAIVDVMLPGLDGISVIEQMRASGCSVPIIILSAKRSVADRIRGLETGSDDYLTKPFSFSELLARVQALLRRSSSAGSESGLQALSLSDLEMDCYRKTVVRCGTKIHLQPREFQLLEYLLRHLERVVSKTMILDQVWDYSFDPQTNVVDVLVCRLRAKIDKGFGVKLLHTIRGVGYVLRVD